MKKKSQTIVEAAEELHEALQELERTMLNESNQFCAYIEQIIFPKKRGK